MASKMGIDYWPLPGGMGTGTMAQTGEKLFKDLSCVTCHRVDTTGRGPTLIGLYGKAVTLDNGTQFTLAPSLQFTSFPALGQDVEVLYDEQGGQRVARSIDQSVRGGSD